MILSPIMANHDDVLFSLHANKILSSLPEVFDSLLDSDSVVFALCGVKAVHSMLKNKLITFLPNGKSIPNSVFFSLRERGARVVSKDLVCALKNIIFGKP